MFIFLYIIRYSEYAAFPTTSYPFFLCLKKTQSLLEVTRKTSQKVNADLNVGLKVEVILVITHILYIYINISSL